MYGPIRDLFIHALGYAPGLVDIDTTGEGGRPDVSVAAPTGLTDAAGKPVLASWIVVEAKDETTAFLDPISREEIFAEKSKYIGVNTNWFVMVDPSCFVARLVAGRGPASDIVAELTHCGDVGEFSHKFARLKADVAGVSEQLRRFREGDEELIAYASLSPPSLTAPKYQQAKYRILRKRFFENLGDATEHLQDASLRALHARMEEVKRFWKLREEFADKYGGIDVFQFNSKTLLVRGKPEGPSAAKAHDTEAKELRKILAKAPAVARLALDSLPQFQARTGAEDDRLEPLFAIESANLILARVLLLRFFEDHEFFGPRRYLCNGGIEAFQRMREYFGESYVGLLEHAYRGASRLYAAAFDETELDWIFTHNDVDLSAAIEWVLFQFAKYDFRSVKGDILTGIYDRFLDRKTRKQLGEFYTPPSIARYMIERVDLRSEDFVFDPACGSGTFLIEAYRHMVGEAVERGVADWSDVKGVISKICGNDLNTFSAIVAQIQMLWQVLQFKSEIEAGGLPDLQITGKVNSLILPDQLGALEKFGELDAPRYAAVVGNPPFVRAERSAQQLDARSIAEFERGGGGFSGVSGELNTYALFLYRALNSWAKPAGPDGRAGKVAFIVPVSLFDSNQTAELRRLLAVGGRWAIREIVDLELIYRDIFDADVLPAIIVCENKPPKVDDVVSVRVATRDCVIPSDDGRLPTFALAKLPESRVLYRDIFTPDGRVLTRLNESRINIVRKLWSLSRLEEAAKKLFVMRRAPRTALAVDPGNPALYEERRLIGGGIAFRGTKPTAHSGGLDVFKAENIVVGEIQGEPVLRGCDIATVDDPALWRFASLLPHRAFAIARVAHCPNAAPFDPHSVAFTNTATILVPRDDLSAFPFDLLLLSRPYIYFYAIAARMGVLRLCRSDVYPTNLKYLPWTESLVPLQSEIEAIRTRLVTACTDFARTQEALLRELSALRLPTIKARARADAAVRLRVGDGFLGRGARVEIARVAYSEPENGVARLEVGDDLLSWIEVSPSSLGRGLARILNAYVGEEISRGDILELGIPVSPEEVALVDKVDEKYAPTALAASRSDVLNILDHLVGQGLGLSDSEIKSIQVDCATDAFLQKIEPRYPGTVTRKQGFRTGLDAAARYSG